MVRPVLLPMLGALSLSLAACAATPPPPPAPPVASAPPAAAPPPNGPPAAQGTFELVRGTDGKTSVSFRDVIHKNAIDGKILWTFEGASFSIGIWLLTTPKRADEGGGSLYSLCRATTKVDARWEGSAVVLPTTLAVRGWSTAANVAKSHDTPGKTTTTTVTAQTACSASIDTTRLAVEVVEKDAAGPTKLRVTAQGGTFDLERAAPIDALDANAIVSAASK